MLTFPTALKIYLAVEPVDMRKQFNGLWALAEQKLSEDPRRGAVFVFTNKDRNRLKMLYWDGYVTPVIMGRWKGTADRRRVKRACLRRVCVAY